MTQSAKESNPNLVEVVELEVAGDTVAVERDEWLAGSLVLATARSVHSSDNGGDAGLVVCRERRRMCCVGGKQGAE
jgi:hypothetical protein